MKELLPNLNVVQLPVGDLLPYARNARTHSDIQVLQIAASIKEFGFNNPVLIRKDNTIIAGHGRVLAAVKLDMTHVPCIYLDHLTDNEARAYVLADNQLATKAGWDNEVLSLELQGLMENGIDPDVLGFSKEDMLKITKDFLPDPQEQEEPFLPSDHLIEIHCSAAGLAQIMPLITQMEGLDGVTVNIS